MTSAAEMAKAIGACAVTAFTGLGLALSDGHLSAGELFGVIGSALAAGGAVYGIPNAVPDGTGTRRADPGTAP